MPVTNSTGHLQQAWYQLLIALWNRTGAAPGVDVIVIVDDLIILSAALAELTIATLPRPSLAGLSRLADEVEALEVLGLQRPGIPASAGNLDLGAILGLMREVMAARLMVPRLIELTGDATGSAYFDGSEDIAIAVTVTATGASGAAVASEALAPGDLCNVYSLAGVATIRKADATDDTKPANAFVTAAVLIAGTATWYGPAQIDAAVSGLTPGETYFLATTPGTVTSTPPSGSGNLVQKVGFAKSATALMFFPTDGVTL